MGIEIENVSDDNPAETTSTYVFDIESEMANGHTCAGIVRILAKIMDENPNEMRPLHAVVNCDAIDALFRTRRYGEARDNVSITFHYDVYEVTVDASGKVAVTE
ncbi:HalOD1 output domain-containing protein [Haladaptatus caseinilyticus]|uniref:HalOD1 output domain-containing protein n=1 Tax=Haladaptatus caseinilyticus TaxID=2993314 RepID=UPI00224AEB61|nr:HalOD1 output domain-containing protein [Haladaptatus caseinilyticus]